MALLERLRAALAPDYDVEAPLAEGGMGLVFRARDVQLQRPVAIKVLRPELATAAYAERFLREARTLAGFRHPNIVRVYRAGEADGLAWYAMDLLEGETLADRLAKGTLPRAEALALTDQVLSALEAVHARGVVHRDIKPSNVFLAGGDAVVGDFGIAKSVSGDGPQMTQPGHPIGTPGFMPPEQALGGEVSARTDLCAVGMLLYLMLTGRAWPFDVEAPPDWRGVDADLRPALAHALAWDPHERFASAATFRQTLAAAARPRVRGRWVAAGGAALAVLAFLGVRTCAGPAPPPTLAVEVDAFAVTGGAAALGDSLAGEIVTALRAAPEIAFTRGRAGDADRHRADVHVTGHITVRGDTLVASLRSEGRRTGASFAVDAAAGRAALADTLARRLMLGLWTTGHRAFGADLPTRALPTSAAGLGAWASAELLYARAQWGAADSAYRVALALDSTCHVCDLRLGEIARWMRLDLTTERTGRLVAHLDAFPAAQQAIIRVWVDSVDRWGALERLARAHRDYATAQFVVGDEFFHRGPLHGSRRRDALAPFDQATRVRPDFAPAWEHYAWVLIAEGEEAPAAHALARFAATAAGDDMTSALLGVLLRTGFLWRFRPHREAAESTAHFLAHPVVQAFPDLAAGPRFLMSFDAPEGVVWLGLRFAAWTERPDLAVPGLAGQVMGRLALGQSAAAREAAARLRATSSDAEFALAAAALDVALLRFDSGNVDTLRPATEAALRPLTHEGAATAEQRRRAAWLLALAARHAGDATAARGWRALLDDEPAPRPFGTLLDADAAARQGGAARALGMTARLPALDSSGRAGDPLFRAALHFLRAEWQEATGNPLAAVRELRWHENSDLVGRAATVMQSADFDWALGTLARWHRARIIGESALARDEACRAYADVIRLWHGGEPRAAWRAREARVRREALGCAAP